MEVVTANILWNMDVVSTIDRFLSGRGMQRKDLASALGWSESKLSKVIGKASGMKVSDVQMIADAIGVRFLDLVADEEELRPALNDQETLLLDAVRDMGYREAMRRLTIVGPTFVPAELPSAPGRSLPVPTPGEARKPEKGRRSEG